jgi:hypothetical protein
MTEVTADEPKSEEKKPASVGAEGLEPPTSSL